MIPLALTISYSYSIFNFAGSTHESVVFEASNTNLKVALLKTKIFKFNLVNGIKFVCFNNTLIKIYISNVDKQFWVILNRRIDD